VVALAVVAAHRQVLVVVFGPVMVVLALLRVEVFPLQTLLLLAVLAAHDLARHPEPLAVQAAHPALLALRALRLLPVGYSVKVEVVAVVVPLALAVLAVLEVAALVAVAVVLAVALTQQALVVSVVQAGHWYWSFDYAAICRC